MPKIKNPSQGSKLYSGKIRSPLQGMAGKNTKEQDNKVDLITESFTLNGEGSKLQLNHGGNRKDDAHAAGNTLSLQEDFDKIEKLSMINANARYELINANQQLIDFQMNRYIKHTKDQRKLKFANQHRENSLNNNSKGGGTGQDSFELPEIPNISKADRVKSGQQRNNTSGFYLSKQDDQYMGNFAGKQRQRLDKLPGQFPNHGGNQVKVPPASDMKNNFSSYQIPADILDFTTTPGSRMQQMIQNINTQSHKPPKGKQALSSSINRNTKALDQPENAYQNIVPVSSAGQGAAVPPIPFQPRKKFREDYQGVLGGSRASNKPRDLNPTGSQSAITY